MMWLSLQPRCNRHLKKQTGLLRSLWQIVESGAEYDYDLVILLIATSPNVNKIEELFNLKKRYAHKNRTRKDEGTVSQFIMGIFDVTGHSLCSRWAALCMALRLSGAKDELNQIRRGRFCQQLVNLLVEWLQGGHPYKA